MRGRKHRSVLPRRVRPRERGTPPNPSQCVNLPQKPTNLHLQKGSAMGSLCAHEKVPDDALRGYGVSAAKYDNGKTMRTLDFSVLAELGPRSVRRRLELEHRFQRQLARGLRDQFEYQSSCERHAGNGELFRRRNRVRTVRNGHTTARQRRVVVRQRKRPLYLFHQTGERRRLSRGCRYGAG